MEGCTASGRSFAQRPTRSHVNVGESFRAARCRRAGSAQPSPRLAAVLRTAGPSDEPPDYSAIDAQPLNKLVYSLFRRRMAAAVGSDSPEQGCASPQAAPTAARQTRRRLARKDSLARVKAGGARLPLHFPGSGPRSGER